MQSLPIFDSLDESRRVLIENYLNCVIEANRTLNLTRIDSKEEGMLLHVEDSLTALPEANAAPVGRCADIGSGGGFPGVPLSIATDRPTTLIDMRKKKMEAVREIVGKLDLNHQVETYAGRTELFARKSNDRFTVVTARALAKLPVLLELASPLLEEQGVLICYKANVENEELEEAQRVATIVGMAVNSDRTFTLGENYTRRIITFKKVKPSSIPLPRLEGQAQKNPL